MFDFGGVVTTSPFEAFARYEQVHGCPPGFIRGVNATDPDTNAWARLERGEIGAAEFALAFGEESRLAGHHIDGAEMLAMLSGEVRPEMVRAIRRCGETLKTACLTNNYAGHAARGDVEEIFALFDLVLESSRIGIRKPEPAFYRLACESLGVEPHEVVYLDDLGVHLKPARAMGMRTIKVTSAADALGALSEATGLQFD
jgi:putative hydrolase of the HAD superfamily